jgi:AraC family transcriptional regulator
MDVQIVNQPDLRIAGIRHIGAYDQIGRDFGRLGGLLKGPPPTGSQMIAVYHDDPAATPVDHLRSDAALTLPGATHAPDGLIEQRLPAGRYAKAVHKGGYEGLPATWDALKKEWLPASGHQMGHPSYEIYVNNPMTTPKEGLVTEIYLRISS